MTGFAIILSFYPYLIAMKKALLTTLICTSIFLAGCTQSQPQTCSLTETSGNACTSESWTLPSEVSALDTAKAILQTLKNNDYLALAAFVGPEWVRFSPYTYVNTGTDVVLIKDEIYNWLALSRTFIRWSYDGSWEPIDLPFWPYFEKFVYDVDFLNAPEVNENKEIMRGNIINNVFDIYKDKEIIEFYIPGIDPKYDGMDRRSLTLVLEKTDGKWILIGVIHNQRTI